MITSLFSGVDAAKRKPSTKVFKNMREQYSERLQLLQHSNWFPQKNTAQPTNAVLNKTAWAFSIHENVVSWASCLAEMALLNIKRELSTVGRTKQAKDLPCFTQWWISKHTNKKADQWHNHFWQNKKRLISIDFMRIFFHRYSIHFGLIQSGHTRRYVAMFHVLGVNMPCWDHPNPNHHPNRKQCAWGLVIELGAVIMNV